MPNEQHTPIADVERDNVELRRRLAVAEAALAEMRIETLHRRAEVRDLAESLPSVVSRQTMLRSIAHDLRYHPDRSGIAKRAVAKAGRAPRKAIRLVRERL